MTLTLAELQKLNPGSIIELYVLDATALGGSTYRFHAGKNELRSNVVWDGNTYTAIPIQVTGFEYSGKGSFPRPRMSVSNVLHLMSGYCNSYRDLAGAKLTRIRTLTKYLDAVNFPNGNETADPTAKMADDVYFIERKTLENKHIVEFELVSAVDCQGVKLPRRVMTASTCSWEYKGAECGYTGGLSACGKTIAECKAHFGETATLPFGGFPGCGRYPT
jgi:lambda family phage minor tail protein L